ASQHVGIEPTRISELKRDSPATVNTLQERIQPGEVLLEISRQLKEDRAAMFRELRRGAKEGGRRALHSFQAPEVRDRRRRLERKPKACRHLARPRLEESRIGHPAKRTVDFDC